jgi:hypothetical protein
MKKEFIFIIVLAFIILIFGGIFLWSSFEKEMGTIIEEVKFEPAENYVIKDTPEGKIVENENVGLKFKVPDGWQVEKRIGSFADKSGTQECSIIVSSPDAKVSTQINIPEKGCGISIRVEHRYSEKEFHIVANLIKSIQENPENESLNYEILQVAKRPALKEILFDNEKIGQAISVSLPINEKVYIFETLILSQEKERCLEEFNKFLKTVAIE